MSLWVEVSGAYGRDYKSAKAAKLDYAAGKDFLVLSGGNGHTVLNKQDADTAGLKLLIRYQQNLKVARLN